MRLTINLSTKTYLNRSYLNMGFAALLILLLMFLVLNLKGISTTTGETDRIRTELLALEKKSGSKGRKVPEAEYQNLVKQITFANEIIKRKTFSWLALLDKLETVVPDSVTLTNITPDIKKRELKLSGTTLTFPGLRRLLEQMEVSGHFTDIYLISQADARVGETQKGITFSINCKVKM